MMRSILTKLSNILASKRLLYIILGFFIFEALWFVFSAIYPMAFDEDFHFGIIKIYSTHWLPFLKDQPAGGDPFGALARDPSYLYQYLMSFPYRLLTHITTNQTAQIIALRILNVAFFTSGLVLFWKLIVRALHSPALANVSLIIFILIPITPQLAAHINYDNLLLPLTAWTCLLVYDAIEQFRRHTVNLKTLFLVVNVGLLTSLVKYAYLPIFVAAIFFLLVYSFITLRRGHWPTMLRQARAGLSLGAIVGFSLLTLLSAGLFVQRYGINTVKYHTPIASCDQVLDYSHCSSYGPWIRNYNYAQSKTATDVNPLAYLYTWQQGLRYRLFFAINGPVSGYTNYPPLPLPYQTSVALAVIALVVLIWYGRRIFRQPFMSFAGLATAAYLVALFGDDYRQFLSTGQPVAINGRYLLPVLFLIALLMGRGLQLALVGRRAWLKPVAASLVILLFLQGGGVMTFILRSDASWDWHNNTIIRVNNDARRLLAPIIIEGSKYY